MSEFPYPGISELRERYTWNIQPFSSTFDLLRQQVHSILSDNDENAPDYAGRIILITQHFTETLL
jgi:hypothetical protein